MQTARLDEVVRQRDARLKEVVEQLARGEVREAIENMACQGRVLEIADPEKRMRAVAADYAAEPDNTLVVSPDNASRIEINRLIHEALRADGKISRVEFRHAILTPRQELTGADRQWASRYEAGDVIRYSKGSRAVGVAAGEYVRVLSVDRERNLLTVRRENGAELAYDPRRLQGVCVYREDERQFSGGERIQFTSPHKNKRVSNRQLGTIEHLDAEGNLRLRFDSGRSIAFNIREHPHLDYGYAVTSHSAQGATADRVLIHVDSVSTNRNLINSRLAYVAVSRARHDARIYTGDAAGLGSALSHSVSKRSALATDHDPSAPAQEQRQNPDHEQSPADPSSGRPTLEPSRSRSVELER